MILPDLASQIVYGRVGWAIVAATVACAVWRGAAPMPRATLAAILAGALALMALPGNLSPAWYLGLAFQYPSGLLVACCVLRLTEYWNNVRRSQAMPQTLACILAAAGMLLYLDALGVLTSGYYYAGFGGGVAPLAATAFAVACALAIVLRQAPGHAAAILCAVALFSVLRLPTGNLWDALLDPLLFGWAVVALLAGARRRKGRRVADRSTPSNGDADADPAPGPALQPIAAEHFTSLKEQVGGQ
jgi:hypothetical protein